MSNNWVFQDLDTIFASYRSTNSAKKMGGGLWKIVLFAIVFLVIAIVLSGLSSKNAVSVCKYLPAQYSPPHPVCPEVKRKCPLRIWEKYNLF